MLGVYEDRTEIIIWFYRLAFFFWGGGHPVRTDLIYTPAEIKSRGFRINIIDSWFMIRSHYGPGVDSASNRNEYQEHFLGVKAAGA